MYCLHKKSSDISGISAPGNLLELQGLKGVSPVGIEARRHEDDVGRKAAGGGGHDLVKRQQHAFVARVLCGARKATHIEAGRDGSIVRQIGKQCRKDSGKADSGAAQQQPAAQQLHTDTDTHWPAAG